MKAKVEQMYSQNEILALIETFGLKVDYDQWNVDSKLWIRVVHPELKKHGALVLYREDGPSTNLDELRQFLIDTGARLKAKSIRRELYLDD